MMERADIYSGGSMSRTGLEDILDAAHRSELDVVVCTTIDRSNRNLGDLLMFDKELTALGIELEFVRDTRDRTPQGNLFFQMKGAFAEYERAVIIDRMRRGRIHSVKAGNVLRNEHMAYGYRYNPTTRNLDIMEDEANIVREMFEWIGVEGRSALSMIFPLQARGVPTPKQGKHWSETTITGIIHNEVYAGRWTYYRERTVVHPRKPRYEGDIVDPADIVRSKVIRPRSEWLFVSVPPIVSEELWQAANAQIRKNANLSKRNRSREYMLAGMLICQDCGASMYGWLNGTLSYYRCNREPLRKYYGKDTPECRVQMVRTEALDNSVRAEVIRQFEQPDALRAMLTDTSSRDPRLLPSNKLRITNIARQRASLERDGEKLLDLYLAGHTTREVYIKRMERIKSQQSALDKEDAEIQQQIADYEVQRRAALSLQSRIEGIKSKVGSMTKEELRALLLSLSVAIVVQRAPNKRDGHLIGIENLLQSVTDMPVPPIPPRWRNQFTDWQEQA